MNPKALALLGLLALLAWTRPASAETYHACTSYISVVPATITQPGVYCLATKLSSASSTTFVSVNTNNVTIDCNGHMLDASGAGLGNTSTGVYANVRNGTQVRNCTFKGFKSAIWLIGSTGRGNVVEDNIIDGSTYVGIIMNGDNSVVRRNVVVNTGGSTLYPTPYGIYAYNSVDVTDNTIAGVTARTGGGGSAYGIYTNNPNGGTVSGNRVRNLSKDGAGATYGIYIYATGRQVVQVNDLFCSVATASVGVYCSTISTHVRNNVINGWSTAIAGGCVQGNDNVAE
jgi:parallel beta-helix repeat protein